jgi:ABC-2 type transport system permease protein
MTWAWTVLTLEIRKTLSYRVDFWLGLLGNALAELALAFFLWQTVFEFKGVDSLGGYSFHALMYYYAVAPFVARAVRGYESYGVISQDIYDGSLTRYLIYPVSYYLYKFAIQMANVASTLVQLFVVTSLFLLCFGTPAGVTLSALGVSQAVLLIMVGCVLYFLLVSSLELVAFWADNVWSLIVMLRFISGFLGGVLIPLSLYPENLRRLIDLTPFPYLISAPAHCFFSPLPQAEFLNTLRMLFIWLMICAVLNVFLWRRGLARYTGVGM